MANSEHPSRRVFDVVCGMDLDMENVRHSFEHNGTEYYFCSDGCKSRFVEDPDTFADRLINNPKK